MITFVCYGVGLHYTEAAIRHFPVYINPKNLQDTYRTLSSLVLGQNMITVLYTVLGYYLHKWGVRKVIFSLMSACVFVCNQKTNMVAQKPMDRFYQTSQDNWALCQNKKRIQFWWFKINDLFQEWIQYIFNHIPKNSTTVEVC